MSDKIGINVCLIWGQLYTALVHLPVDKKKPFLPVILEYLPETHYQPSLRRTVLKRNAGKWALKNLKHYKSSSLSWSEAFLLQQQQHTFLTQPKNVYSPLRQEQASHAAQTAARAANIVESAKKE